MSLKVKLISTISAFVLVLSMLFVGVFAAQNVELNVGGNVSFTASSVYAQITGSYVGTVEHPSTAQSLTPINIDAEDEDGAVSMPSDWTSMPLNFDSSASPITVTITIQNLATDRAIAVSLTDNTDITGVSVARLYNSTSFSSNTSSQIIAGGGTGTFTFTLSVINKNSDISGTFDLDLDLISVITKNVTVNVSRSDYYSALNASFYYSINGEEKIETESSQFILNDVFSIQFSVSANIGSGGSIRKITVTFSPAIYQEKEYEFEVIGHEGTAMTELYDIDKDVTISVYIEIGEENAGGGIIEPEF